MFVKYFGLEKFVLKGFNIVFYDDNILEKIEYGFMSEVKIYN